MKNICCPLCNKSDYRLIYRTDKSKIESKSYKIVRCKICNHMFTLIESSIELQSFYINGDYKVVDIRKSIFDKILNFEYSNILKKLNHYYPEKGMLLDFGCGKGKFLWLAKNYGWEVKGIETSDPRANYGRNIYKLDISTDIYKGGQIEKGPFEVISFFHVLEHLINPKELLSKLVSRNLSLKGILLVEIPNYNSIQSKISKNQWIHLDIPRHISHFTNNSLKDFLSFINLKPIKYEYFSFHLGVLGMIQTILGIFGYRKSLIIELKYYRRIGLLFIVILVLPIAFILEYLSSLFGKGGIIRVYATLSEKFYPQHHIQ